MSFEIGKKVTIKDGSYMATQLKDGTISHRSEGIPVIGWNRDNWTIILRQIAFPVDYSEFLSHQNNFLIQNDVNGELWFCSKINIVEVDAKLVDI
jgi:hypothetical protein